MSILCVKFLFLTSSAVLSHNVPKQDFTQVSGGEFTKLAQNVLISPRFPGYIEALNILAGKQCVRTIAERSETNDLHTKVTQHTLILLLPSGTSKRYKICTTGMSSPLMSPKGA